MNRPLKAVLALVVCALILSACAGEPPPRPLVMVDTPLGYTQFREGDVVAVPSTSTDQVGVTKVELWVDGKVVQTDVAPTPAESYSVVQTWQASAGPHVLTVRAYNVDGNASDDVSISLAVIMSPSPAVQSPVTARVVIDGTASIGISSNTYSGASQASDPPSDPTANQQVFQSAGASLASTTSATGSTDPATLQPASNPSTASAPTNTAPPSQSTGNSEQNSGNGDPQPNPGPSHNGFIPPGHGGVPPGQGRGKGGN